MFPCDPLPARGRPSTSSVNFPPGSTVANEIIATLDDRGDVCIFSLVDTDVVVDVVAYIND